MSNYTIKSCSQSSPCFPETINLKCVTPYQTADNEIWKSVINPHPSCNNLIVEKILTDHMILVLGVQLPTTPARYTAHRLNPTAGATNKACRSVVG